MAVRIIEIAPKVSPMPEDSILAHLTIENFKWVNEQSQQQGVSSRAAMFDWIVNKHGKAYIKKGDNTIFVFGANIPSGQYIRALVDEKWTDDLLELPEISK